MNQLYTFFENAEDIFGISGETILRDVRPYSKLSPQDYQTAVSNYFSHPDDQQTVADAFTSIFNGKPTTYEARMRAGGSNYIWCKLDVIPILENNKTTRMIGVITDISHQKEQRDHLEKAALLDKFTGLYNKASSIERIHKTISENTSQQHALVLLDIDNFKSFNDAYGHAIGDVILKSEAEKLKLFFQPTDIIGRFGGDEFIVLVKNLTDFNHFKDTLQNLVTCHSENYHWTNSIGIALFPQDADEFDSLFQKADAALYRSKLSKNTYTFYFD